MLQAAVIDSRVEPIGLSGGCSLVRLEGCPDKPKLYEFAVARDLIWWLV
jgi:hypothetical protein